MTNLVNTEWPTSRTDCYTPLILGNQAIIALSFQTICVHWIRFCQWYTPLVLVNGDIIALFYIKQNVFMESSSVSDTYLLYKWIKPLLLGHLDNMLMFKRWFSVSKIICDWLTDIRARSRDPSGLKIVVWTIIVVQCQFYVFLRFVLESLYKTTQYISIIISKVPCVTTLHPPINLNILFWRQIGAAATIRSSKETTKQSMQPILFQCVECSGVINILFIIEL